MNKIMTFTVVALLFQSCQTPQQQEEKTEAIPNGIELKQDQIAQLGIECKSIPLDTITSETIITGILQVPPTQSKIITYPISAKITELNVAIGQNVSKGQVLAKLSDMAIIQIQEDYLKSKWQVELFSNEFKRQESLLTKNATSDKAFQESKSQLLMAEAALSAIQQRLQLLSIATPRDAQSIQSMVSICAPMDGKVTQCLLQDGQYLNAGQTMIEISDIKNLWVDASVYQNESMLMNSNTTVIIQDPLGRKETGEILYQTHEISNVDQANHVWIKLNKTHVEWMPGMPVECHLGGKTTAALALPKNALVQYQNQPYIFVESAPLKYEMRKAQILQEDEEQIFIAPDLSPDIRIVTNGAYYLLMAMKND